MSDERIAASVKEKGLKAVVRPAAMYGLEMLKMELPSKEGDYNEDSWM